MSQGFVNLGNLIPGERYSFKTKDIPGGRSPQSWYGQSIFFYKCFRTEWTCW